jgi:hypothetical protein
MEDECAERKDAVPVHVDVGTGSLSICSTHPSAPPSASITALQGQEWEAPVPSAPAISSGPVIPVSVEREGQTAADDEELQPGAPENDEKKAHELEMVPVSLHGERN